MKKNTDFANSERRIFISKTYPRVPRDRPPLLAPAKKSVLFTVALIVTGGLAAGYLLTLIVFGVAKVFS